MKGDQVQQKPNWHPTEQFPTEHPILGLHRGHPLSTIAQTVVTATGHVQ